jgi:hypothetical protein
VKKPNFKTCFISAPFGVDTSVIRNALEANSINWSDQTTLGLSTSWLENLDFVLQKTDFICAVLPETQHGNILFELGIAYGKGKPILAFVGPSAKVPSDLSALTYVRANPTDAELINTALVTFLRHAKRSRPSRSQSRKTSAKPRLHSGSPIAGHELEQRTASLLQDAGFIVASPAEVKDRGADFAVWADELQSTLGNPLLVQVKGGSLTKSRIEEAAAQLRRYAESVQGRCALLVYWDKDQREFPIVSRGWPLIIQLSGVELMRLVEENRLSDELLRRRNAAVHGEV